MTGRRGEAKHGRHEALGAKTQRGEDVPPDEEALRWLATAMRRQRVKEKALLFEMKHDVRGNVKFMDFAMAMQRLIGKDGCSMQLCRRLFNALDEAGGSKGHVQVHTLRARLYPKGKGRGKSKNKRSPRTHPLPQHLKIDLPSGRDSDARGAPRDVVVAYS